MKSWFGSSVMQAKDQQVIHEIGDTASLGAVVGVLADVIPLLFGVLAAGWYVLRFLNWYRVNYQGKEPWELR